MSDFNRESECNSPALNELIAQGILPGGPIATGYCQGCGCSHFDPCVDEDTGAPCSWSKPGLCSFCADLIVQMELRLNAGMLRPDDDEPEAPMVQLYSPHEAQRAIEQSRAMRTGVGA